MHMVNNLKKNGAITAVYDISADTLAKAKDLVRIYYDVNNLLGSRSTHENQRMR